MSHEYIAATTGGDQVFTTDLHHSEHHRGIEGWYEVHKPFLDGLISAGTQLLGVYVSHRGQRGAQVVKVR